tara:strand:- start:1563 stop:2309 length:747 start_codon:yes stop_codon:yes gene_type:complete
MAKVNTQEKQFFIIEGLPRSGTTILTNIMNSFENGFCFSEPIWQLIQDPFSLRLGKLNNKIWPTSLRPETVVEQLKNVLRDDIYSIGGLKETYRDWQPECVNMVLDSDLQFRIFILRDPRYNFSGWKKSPFGSEYYDVDIFARNYERFCDRIKEKSQVTPTYVIKYENLCKSDDTLSYLSNALGNRFSLTGNLQLKQTGYHYGDARGNSSSLVSAPRESVDNLTSYEVGRCEDIMSLYQNIDEGLCSK